MAYARIVHHWDSDAATVCEVGSDEAAHPDLLDELCGRVLVLWRETCAATAGDDDDA